MIEQRLGKVVRYLRRVATNPNGEALSDGQLLRQFVDGRDEAAFALLVERHGPMVLGICRRMFHDCHDAEDVFQATFLVLARKAGAIRKQESVGCWLYGVAQRVAHKARRRLTLQRSRETVVAELPSVAAQPEPAWDGISPVLDEELGRLPDRYRVPIILCYLEGKTNEEAARELGCPKGTVSGRLARARDLLRKRLQRRGLAVTSALLAALLCERVAPAAVPGPLFVGTVNAGCSTTAGLALGGSTRAFTLAEGVLRTMLLTKTKIALGILLAVAAVPVSVALIGYASTANDAPQKTFLVPVQAGGAPSDHDLLQGTWQVISAQAGGQDLGNVKAFKITFDGDKYHVVRPGYDGVGTFKLITDTSPRRIDLQPDDEKNMELGIYKLAGDSLHLCSDDYNKGRPTSFISKPGTIYVSMVLQRVGSKAAAGKAELERLRAENLMLRDKLDQLHAKLDAVKKLLGKDEPGMTEQSLLIEAALKLLAEKQAAEKDLQEKKLHAYKQTEDMKQILPENSAKAKSYSSFLTELLATYQPKEAANRAISTNNLKQIALAMHVYHDVYKGLPAAAIYSKAGKPLLSWRVAILPFVEQQKLYQEFKLDEPWDSPHNIKLLDKMPPLYAPVGVTTKDKHSTFYQVFTGPHTLFDGKMGKKFVNVTDGTSNSALAIEAGTAVPWTKPADLEYDATKPLPKLGGLFKGGFNLATADGATRFVPAGFNEKIMRLIITIDDGMVFDWEDLSPKKGAP